MLSRPLKYLFGFFPALCLALIQSAPTEAAILKKVLILNFNNLDAAPEFDYLESSITDNLRKKLQEDYAFQETPKEKIRRTAKTNYIFEEDSFTKTAALNLGLLARQDVAIAGGFRVTGPKEQSVIEMKVRIIDINKKKEIAYLKEKGPANNRIFDTIGSIVNKIAIAMQDILPSKEAWARSSLDDTPGLPFIDNWSIGIRAGGALYIGGWAEQLTPDQPAFGITNRFQSPRLGIPLDYYFDVYFVSHTLDEDAGTALNSLNLTSESTNIMPMFAVGMRFALNNQFALRPKVGGGIVLQRNQISGEFSSSTDNSFPFVTTGLDLEYNIDSKIDLVLQLQSMLQIEEGITTYSNLMTLGADYRL